MLLIFTLATSVQEQFKCSNSNQRNDCQNVRNHSNLFRAAYWVFLNKTCVFVGDKHHKVSQLAAISILSSMRLGRV